MKENERRLILGAFDLGVECAQTETAEYFRGTAEAADDAASRCRGIRAELVRLLDAMLDEEV